MQEQQGNKDNKRKNKISLESQSNSHCISLFTFSKSVTGLDILA